MSGKSGIMKLDFAGPHGTAWGSVNLGLTVVTFTTCGHVFFGAPWWTSGLLMGAGFLLTLMWAALRTAHTPPATVVYQLACWAGSGVWSAWMLNQAHWSFQSWGRGVLYWAAATTIAGMALALGRQEKATTRLTEDGTPTVVSGDGLTQGERDALGARVQEAIDMLANNPKPQLTVPGREPKPWKSMVKFTALVPWKDANGEPTGYGYTIEGSFPGGVKFGLPQLQLMCPSLAQELNLPYGCKVTAREHEGAGAGRRDFLLDVATGSALVVNQPFPLDQAPFSINTGSPLAFDERGIPWPVYLRTNCFAAFGGTGSGKTGTMKALSGILALTSDCIMVGIDATGGDLVRPMMAPYDDGRAEFPAFSAVATTYPDAERLVRALLRISYARKAAYQYVLDRENTTLLPMGAIVRRSELTPAAQEHFPHAADQKRMIPQIMLVGDETRDYLCTGGAQPVLRELVGRMIRETRGAGIRGAFGPLGPSNANIDQSLQDLIKTNIAMFLGKNSDFRDALGGGNVQVSDFPMKPDGTGKVEGVAFGVRERGQQETQIRVVGEMTPSLVHEIAIMASEEGYLPELDYVSELAANGFNPDGTPMRKQAGVYQDGDEYFWRDRWNNWSKGGTRTAEVQSQPSSQPAAPAAPVQNATALMDKLREKRAAVEKAADERVAEVTGRPVEEVTFDRESVEAAASRWPATFEELAGLELEDGQPEEPWRDRLLDAIRAKGSEGAKAEDLVELSGKHRSTVYVWLKKLVDTQVLIQPRDGFYSLRVKG